jgi:predicted ArsR family transcriptional regulator
MASAGSIDERLLSFLKFRGSQTAAVIARHLEMTIPGVRKHLSRHLEEKLVEFTDEIGHVGRPRRLWQLTPKAQARFPDSHAVLTLELIGAARKTFGDDGLNRLIALREAETREKYAASLAKAGTIRKKVAKLAALRSSEGYMAEWRALADGSLLLIENHCPICAAAKECQGFCRSELATFRAVLGPAVTVERIDHILAGARRCAYRISSA